jgi:sarcosine oxidase delta subunit
LKAGTQGCYVKAVWKDYLFLADSTAENTSGNWVERGGRCKKFLAAQPKVKARFLDMDMMGKKGLRFHP